ncbi:hypothetical protein [Altererythrobacter sp.]|uniref:hypothetical protein n=1 Tax=Altererythrobacter sp. TaxID=1872480 RepID=UPI001B069DFB|nr:hypothetical protein [Altererythrobacter sp.]MBO6945192.1 hypothetical protein [Altererythrobacter sp.]
MSNSRTVSLILAVTLIAAVVIGYLVLSAKDPPAFILIAGAVGRSGNEKAPTAMDRNWGLRVD